MDRQNFKNANGMFPVTTETFDFMQEQIFLAAQLARIVGCNVLISMPTVQNGIQKDGLVLIAGELLPLRGTPTGVGSIVIKEENENVLVNDVSFAPIRVRRYAEITDAAITPIPANSLVPIDQLTNRALMQRIATLQTTIDAQQTTMSDQQTTIGDQQTTIETLQKHVVPKGTIIDWYPGETVTAIPENFPENFVPCTACITEANKSLWEAKYSGIEWASKIYRPRPTATAGTRLRITQCNGVVVPDLDDLFLRGAGTGKGPGLTGGAEEVTLTKNNLPAGFKFTNYMDSSLDQTNSWVPDMRRSSYGFRDGASEPFSILPPYFTVYKLIKVI